MVGMLIAHYVEQDAATGFGGTIRDFVDGRAMPLFVLLGGIGVTLLTTRSRTPDLALVIRALILFPLGLWLQHATTDIAIILQYYAVFFLLAIGLRRLPDRGLLAVAVLVTAIGAVTNQTLSPPTLPSYGGWEGMASLVDPGLWWAILVNGYYPVLPTSAFFIVGMWLGRRRLDDIAVPLVWSGAALAFTGSWVGAWIGDLVGASLEDTTADGFRWEAMFDATGHSEMPVWVMGATGTSLLVIGASVLAALRWQLRPLVVLGQMALTFYVFQALVINWTPLRSDTTTGEEYLLATSLTLGFLLFATLWVRFVSPRGPLELMLRAADPGSFAAMTRAQPTVER